MEAVIGCGSVRLSSTCLVITHYRLKEKHADLMIDKNKRCKVKLLNASVQKDSFA